MEHGAVDNDSSRVTRPPAVPPRTALGGQCQGTSFRVFQRAVQNLHVQIIAVDGSEHARKGKNPMDV